MVVQVQQLKRDEQYPLLKVNTGAGDNNHSPQPPSVISPGWNVACVPRRSWLDKWPEIISGCWMTLILLGITFLVFYALGMSAYRRQPIIFIKCNNTSRSENNVFYHHIVPRGSYVSLSLYSDYLSRMAVEYPFLNFKVFFLLDDSVQTSMFGSKHSRLMKRFGPKFLGDAHGIIMNERDKQDLKHFQRRYGNVNITVTPLSNYMAMTPLRYKWKMIPIFYLPFYARVFSVWEFGGVGLDLTAFNNQYNSHQLFDPKMKAILKQHNDGIETEKYVHILNTINRDEQADFLNIFYNLMFSIFNETYSFFDFPVSNVPVTTDTKHPIATVSRNYRNKRENLVSATKSISGVSTMENNTNVVNNNVNETVKLSNIFEKDLYGIVKNATSNNGKTLNNSLTSILINNKSANSTFHKESKVKNDLEKKLNISEPGLEVPQVVLLYDFMVFSDGLGPSHLWPEVVQSSKIVPKSNGYVINPNKPKSPPYLLSITTDGTFLAATSRHHPFLSHLFSSGCKRVNPIFAIEDTLLSQCSGLLRNDLYCDSIYILG